MASWFSIEPAVPVVLLLPIDLSPRVVPVDVEIGVRVRGIKHKETVFAGLEDLGAVRGKG